MSPAPLPRLLNLGLVVPQLEGAGLEVHWGAPPPPSSSPSPLASGVVEARGGPPVRRSSRLAVDGRLAPRGARPRPSGPARACAEEEAGGASETAHPTPAGSDGGHLRHPRAPTPVPPPPPPPPSALSPGGPDTKRGRRRHRRRGHRVLRRPPA